MTTRLSILLALLPGTGCLVHNDNWSTAPPPTTTVQVLVLGSGSTSEHEAAVRLINQMNPLWQETGQNIQYAQPQKLPISLFPDLNDPTKLCSILDSNPALPVPQDEIWLNLASLGQSSTPYYLTCPHFAVMAYDGDNQQGLLQAYAVRIKTAMGQTFPAWLNPINQFETDCGPLDGTPGGGGLCQSYQHYPNLMRVQSTPSLPGGIGWNFQYLPTNSGNFSGYMNNWWVYIVTYNEGNRGLRYPAQGSCSGCLCATSHQDCNKLPGCFWGIHGCWLVGTVLSQIPPNGKPITAEPMQEP